MSAATDWTVVATVQVVYVRPWAVGSARCPSATLDKEESAYEAAVANAHTVLADACAMKPHGRGYTAIGRTMSNTTSGSLSQVPTPTLC